ncbi:MAG TPA: ATP-dependent zinc metalloprotease FtsH [Steroidobacteraceae bacterium]|nr:ATP-dependent zinc metalloprotease FtsH [Steroidobacteraceae bacterium]
MDTRQQQFTLWYFVAALAVVFALQIYLAAPQTPMIGYSDLKTLLKAGRLKDVVIGSDTIEATADLTGAATLLPAAAIAALSRPAEVAPFGALGTKPAAKPPALSGWHAVVARRVEDPQLVAELDAAKVSYTAANENHWLSTVLSWVLPAVVFVGVWNLLLRRSMGGGMGSMMSVGQSKAKVYVQSETGVHFADVAGIDEAKAELMEVVEFLRNPDRYRRLGGKIPKGVLIVGAPGTGKTMLAKAVAGEAGVPFLSISGSEFVEMFVGVGAARVRDLFAQAEQRAPCIIFIDELDALGKARGFNGLSGHDEREQTLNQLLVQMDGFDTKNGVIIMAATNRPEILDPALLRPGRFDRHVAVDRPDVKGREQILKVHTRKVTLGPQVNLAAIAAKTAGFVGADLANIVNEAALRAARLDKPAVDMRDFEEAIDRVVAGLEKRNRVMNPLEKETVAYHEAGHALLAESRPHADRVAKISIIPRGIAALGFTQQLPTEDRYLLKRTELLDRLDVLLGGRVAEELVYGDTSTGAQDDLQRATDMARHMVTQYGMSERLGQVTFDAPRQGVFLNVPQAPPQQAGYSEETARLIDEEIARLMSEAHARVKRTLSEKRALLDELAHLLLAHEVVDRGMLDELLARSAGSAPSALAPAATLAGPTTAAYAPGPRAAA